MGGALKRLLGLMRDFGGKSPVRAVLSPSYYQGKGDTEFAIAPGAARTKIRTTDVDADGSLEKISCSDD